MMFEKKHFILLKIAISQNEQFFYELKNASFSHDGSDKQTIEKQLQLNRLGDNC